MKNDSIPALMRTTKPLWRVFSGFYPCSLLLLFWHGEVLLTLFWPGREIVCTKSTGYGRAIVHSDYSQRPTASPQSVHNNGGLLAARAHFSF